MDLIASGAEAKIFKLDEKTLKKERPEKKYRIKELDLKLRRFRNRREFKILTKLYNKNLNVPKPYEINDSKEDIYFTFEYIEGNILKNVLNEELFNKAFKQIIKMHNEDVVHGDLTTLNMIEKDNEIFLIDFGLGIFTIKVEEKAVDLNLFFTCIKNEHPDLYFMKNTLENKYVETVKNGEKIIKRLHEIEQRGRNK